MTEREKVRRDVLLYGTGFMRKHADGREEHIPAQEMLIERRDEPMRGVYGVGLVSGEGAVEERLRALYQRFDNAEENG